MLHFRSLCFSLAAFAVLAPATFAQTITPLWVASFPEPRSVEASPDGSRVVVGDGAYQASSLIFLDALTGDSLDVIRTPTTAIYPDVFRMPDVMAFEPNGETLLVSHYAEGQGGTSENGTGGGGVDLRRWNPDAPDGEELDYVLNSGTQALAVTDGVLFHVRNGVDAFDNTYVRDLDTTEILFSENNESPPAFAAFSPDGGTLVTIHPNTDQLIRVRRAGVWTPEIVVDIPVFLLDVTNVVFSPDGTRAVVSTRAYTGAGLYVYDTSDWSLERYLPFDTGTHGPSRAFRGVFSDDSDHVVAVERKRVGPDQLDWVVQLTMHNVETGQRVLDEPLTPAMFYARVPPADIKRIPGTGAFVWVGNDQAGVFEINAGNNAVAEEGDLDSEALGLAVAPNPAAGAATVSVRLAAPGEVSLTVHDMLGRTVTTLAAGPHGAGEHRLRLDTASLPSGVYLLRLVTPDAARTERLVVAR